MKAKVAIVTGAAGGLGSKIVESLRSTDYEILPVEHNIDLSTKTGCQVVHNIWSRCFDRLDLLVNCAAICHPIMPTEKIRTIKDIFATNVFSMFYLLQWVIPIMKKQGFGTIINVGSYAGRRAVPNLAAYSASKFAVRGLTEAVAKELGDGIKCISISPGGMNTPMRKKLFGEEDAIKQLDPSIVANVIADIVTNGFYVPSGADVVIRNKNIIKIIEPEV